MDGAMIDRGYERRVKMVEAAAAVTAWLVCAIVFGGAGFVLFHFVNKFW
jgi:hypothetical protein